MHWTSSSIALSATLLFLAPAAQAQTPLAPGELARVAHRAIRGAKTPRGHERRLTRYVSEFTQRWIDQTVCADGYDTDDCGSVVPLST